MVAEQDFGKEEVEVGEQERLNCVVGGEREVQIVEAVGEEGLV